MAKHTLLFTSLFALLGMAFSNLSHAQTLDNFPQSGVLAAQGNLPATGSLAINQLPMGMNGVPVPLLGSLSRNGNNWGYQVSNKTDRSIKVSGELAQFAPGPKEIASAPFTFKLKPQGTDGSTAAVKDGNIGAALRLKRWSWAD